MKKRRGTVVMVVIGVLLCMVVVGGGAMAWFFVSVLDTTVADDVTAARGFDDVRQRFGELQAILEIRDKDAVLTRNPPDAPPASLQRCLLYTSPSPRD